MIQSGGFLGRLLDPLTIVNAFQKILDDSKRKPNKIRVNKGSEWNHDQWNHG